MNDRFELQRLCAVYKYIFSEVEVFKNHNVYTNKKTKSLEFTRTYFLESDIYFEEEIEESIETPDFKIEKVCDYEYQVFLPGFEHYYIMVLLPKEIKFKKEYFLKSFVDTYFRLPEASGGDSISKKLRSRWKFKKCEKFYNEMSYTTPGGCEMLSSYDGETCPQIPVDKIYFTIFKTC